MNNLYILDRRQFDIIISQLNNSKELDPDCIYKIYSYSTEAMQELLNSNILPALRNVNPLDVVYYCVGEYLYTTRGVNEEQRKKMAEDENYISSIASVVSDKYLSLSMFNHVEKKLANRYMPPVSSLNLYLNFILNILQSYNRNDPKTTLISDLLMKSVSISRCIIGLIISGYETEAFSSWRTLHECECTLTLLEKYGDPLINRYLIHMQYGIVFKKEDKEDERGTKIFNDMKEEMRLLGLKSKDIKKFIEYGWLYEIPGIKEDETFKLNFRDGLEKIAGLSMYSDRYEMSSEIIHSTPMLIYSNKEYFYYVTMISTYESFFRLEEVFLNLFAKRVSKEQMERYVNMRKVYYAQLVNIHKRLLKEYQAWSQKKKEN